VAWVSRLSSKDVALDPALQLFKGCRLAQRVRLFEALHLQGGCLVLLVQQACCAAVARRVAPELFHRPRAALNTLGLGKVPVRPVQEVEVVLRAALLARVGQGVLVAPIFVAPQGWAAPPELWVVRQITNRFADQVPTLAWGHMGKGEVSLACLSFGHWGLDINPGHGMSSNAQIPATRKYVA